jgi:hypothetical protein
MSADEKRDYYFTTPDGVEVFLGTYASLAIAKRVFTRRIAADFRSLSIGPYVKDDERVS